MRRTVTRFYMHACKTEKCSAHIVVYGEVYLSACRTMYELVFKNLRNML